MEARMKGASPRCVGGWLGQVEWHRWGCLEMTGSSIWEIEGIRDLESGISFQIPGFGMSDGGMEGGPSERLGLLECEM